MVKKFFLIACCLLSAAALSAQTNINIKLSSDTILIGDQVELDVLIKKDMVTAIQLPEFKEGLLAEKIEIADVPTTDTVSKDSRTIELAVKYKITCFDAGNYNLGKFPILVAEKNKIDTLFSNNDINLFVKTFEIDTTKQQIHDIAEPLDVPLTWGMVKNYVYISLVGLVALAVIVYLLRRYLKRRKNIVVEKFIAPEEAHIIALRQLDNLYQEKLWQSGKIKQYYTNLTDILRNYIEARFSINAMEMTSSQIIDALNEAEINSDETQDLFTISDHVKFAKYIPENHDNESSFVVAKEFIERTKIESAEPVQENNTAKEDK